MSIQNRTYTISSIPDVKYQMLFSITPIFFKDKKLHLVFV